MLQKANPEYMRPLGQFLQHVNGTGEKKKGKTILDKYSRISM